MCVFQHVCVNLHQSEKKIPKFVSYANKTVFGQDERNATADAK
jgi:hypothetical protein